jgi:signal transduction histidine kinase
VRVRARVDGAKLAISVIDDGEGVAEENIKSIFLPFFTTRATGTGLGLPVVQRIAEAHGGGLSHEPTPGGGATFVLRLPTSLPHARDVES